MKNKDILIKITTKVNKCKHCSGYGVFGKNEQGFELQECPKCHSIHPEVFDLSYSNNINKFRFIVTK